MRRTLIGITPLIFTLAACGQTASKPATASTPAAKPPVTAGSAAPQVAPPAHPLTDVQAHELMELTGTDKIKQELLTNMLRYINQAPFMPKDVGEDVRTSVDKTDINGEMVAIYKKYLSTEDAEKAIDFYRSPAGRDLIKANPQIMGEAQHSAMEAGQRVMREVIERHRAEIEAAQKTYQAEHAPPKPPTPGAAPSGAAPSGTAPKTPQR